jgi:hypothetical protein
MLFNPLRAAARAGVLALIGTWALCPSVSRAAEPPEPFAPSEAPEEEHHRFYVGSSLFMIANLFPEPPSFYQLNVGWRPTRRDSLGLEVITWTYHAPLGIQWGPAYGDPAFDYPGHVRDVGVGLTYQRFWWKGLYTQVHATPFVHTYYDEAGERIQTGFFLFTTLRAGYHVGLWRDRVFVEPSVACTWWPVETNTPRGFAAVEARWPDYFLFEPGLHFGVNF